MKVSVFVFWGWAVSIVLIWVLVAIDLQQPLWMRQHSIDLTAYGAFQGHDFQFADAWKLAVSQWLHVKFPHMLFNALIIGSVGAALADRLTTPGALSLGVIGGAVGQAAAAWLQPDAYVSGASQAYLALCGAALIVLPRRSAGWIAAVVGVIVAIALDLFVSAHNGVKPGHMAPFLIGLLVGGCVAWHGRNTAA